VRAFLLFPRAHGHKLADDAHLLFAGDGCVHEFGLAEFGQRSKVATKQLTTMPEPVNHPRDPLHGITLESILNQLVQRHGWSEMGRRIPVRCFQFNPTVKSSLTFLRKTPWARQKVEDWFIAELPRE